MAKIKIGGILQASNLSLIQITGLPLTARPVAAVLVILGEWEINVPVVVQGHGSGGCNNLALAVNQTELERALSLIGSLGEELGAESVRSVPQIGMVAIYGPHFRDRPAIAGTMFSALAVASIDILVITTSISTVACLIAAEDVARAVAVLEETFILP